MALASRFLKSTEKRRNVNESVLLGVMRYIDNLL